VSPPLADVNTTAPPKFFQPSKPSSPEWTATKMTTYSTQQSTRNHFVDPPSLLERVIAGLPSGLAAKIQRLWDRQSYSAVSTQQSKVPRSLRQIPQRWNVRRLLSLPHLLVAVWALLLLWGERWVFRSSVNECEWGNWERWVSFVNIVG
jgi:hypothetical protein